MKYLNKFRAWYNNLDSKFNFYVAIINLFAACAALITVSPVFRIYTTVMLNLWLCGGGILSWRNIPTILKKKQFLL